MSQEPLNSVYKCQICSYTTNYKFNAVRHIKTKHPNVDPLDSIDEESTSKPKAITPPPPPPPPPINDDDEMSYDDLMNLVDQRVEDLLKSNNIAVSPQVRKSMMKKFMTSQPATIFAGVCLGYLITMNAPIVLQAIKNFFLKSQSPSSSGGVQMDQAEIVRQMMLRQKQMNLTPQPPTQTSSSSTQKEPLTESLTPTL